MNRVIDFVVATFLIWLSCGTLCGASSSDKCGQKFTSWNDFNRFELKATVGRTPGYSSWTGTFDKDSCDIQIDIENSYANKITKGKILVVAGRVLLTRGLLSDSRYDNDALNAPLLERELVLRLLGTVLPAGPEETKGARRINHKSAETGIRFATPTAEGIVSAPWRVSGNINVIAANVVEYQLSLSAAGTEGPGGRGGEYNASFIGQMSKVASPKIDDSVPLGGWDLVGDPAWYKTVADVRKKLAVEDYLGEPDPSRNFTGFWKGSCDEAFGLQIMRYGTDGKYSIVFCGPGGCGTPGSEGRTTFITKDSHYEVISETEIKQRSFSGWNTYHRCTKDTHPVLKYREEATTAAGATENSQASNQAGQTGKDPNRPPCNTPRCRKITAFPKTHYCGESPFGNGPDASCDTSVQKKLAVGTKVIADFVCRWTSKCQQEGQPSPEIQQILIGEMRRIGLPSQAEKDVHFTVLAAKSSGWFLIAANYDHISGADLTVCQVIVVTDQSGQPHVLRKVPLRKTNADVSDVTMWSPVDIADVDGEGNFEIILEGDAYENHWLEVLGWQGNSFKTIFSGLGYYL